MTRAEAKQKKAEEKARQKAERAERRAQRKAQLEALKPYWFFLRYNIDARACPQDFFMFWARAFIRIAPFFIRAFFGFIGFVVSAAFWAPILIIVLVILCCVFPILLAILEWMLIIFLINVILGITMGLLLMAGGVPIFMAAAKRRINDVSTTAVEANARFLVFVASGGVTVVSLIICALSWIQIPAFIEGGSLAPIVKLAGCFFFIGLVLSLGQLHYYTFKLGTKGENFAGANPIEVPLTEDFLAEASGHLASRFWQVLAFVLIGCAAGISFALSKLFFLGIEGAATFDLVFKLASNDLLSGTTYGLQAFAAGVFLLIVCSKARIKKGDLGSSQIANINACFKPRLTEISDDLRNQVIERSSQKSESAFGKLLKKFSSFGRLFWVAYKLFFVVMLLPSYYMLLILLPMILLAVVVGTVRSCPIISASFIVLVAAGIFYCLKFRKEEFVAFISMVPKVCGAESWGDLRTKLKVCFIAVIKWPIGQILKMFRAAVGGKTGETGEAVESLITKKRVALRNLSFIDPLGIHQFKLRQSEMGAIQLMLCLLIIGIPISWLWSIFDAFRYNRMSDDQFLMAYPDYCVYSGIRDMFTGKRYIPSNPQ